MKILYLITRAEQAGAQIHVLDLVRGFQNEQEIEIGCGEDGFLLDQARQMGIRCHVVPHLVHPISPVQDTRALGGLVKLIRQTRPDLVHAHTSKAGILGRLAARICGVPAVFTAHTWCFAEGTAWKWRLIGTPLERLTALAGASIINVSEANRELAIENRIAPDSRLITVHNGIPDDDFQSPDFDQEPPVVIMVARCVPQKNQWMLLEAASQLNGKFRIRFVGDGPTRPALEQRAAELGVSVQTEFLGTRSDIAALMRDASIFALPTHWEGFPLSILEAMRAGLPVVACDAGGVREAVIDQENGFLIARGDVEGFAGALRKLLASPELRRTMGNRSRRLFEQSFTSKAMIQKTLEVYRAACSGKVAEGTTVPAFQETDNV